MSDAPIPAIRVRVSYCVDDDTTLHAERGCSERQLAINLPSDEGERFCALAGFAATLAARVLYEDARVKHAIAQRRR